MRRKAIIKKLTKSKVLSGFLHRPPRAVLSAVFCIFFCVFFCTALTGCRKPESAYVRTSFALDTVVQVTVYEEKDLPAVQNALSLCSSLEKVFSRTDPEAELCRLNEAAKKGETFTCSPDLLKVLTDCMEFSYLSDGAFDITLGALSSRYDFSGNAHHVPDEAERIELLSHTGIDKICVCGEECVFVGDPETVLDLGAAAKGYIADRMKEQMVSSGVEHAIINLGGNILVIGQKPASSGRAEETVPFDAGIAKPVPGESNEVFLHVSLSDDSLVTSGTYQRCFEQDGVFYHHILDPKTGLPADNGLASVSVLTKRSALADILSTACFVLGPEGSQQLIDRIEEQVEVIFIDRELNVTRIHN